MFDMFGDCFVCVLVVCLVIVVAIAVALDWCVVVIACTY